MNETKCGSCTLCGVTLYRTGAEAVWRLEARLPAGDSVVTADGFSSAYDFSRAGVQGTGAFALLSVSAGKEEAPENGEVIAAKKERDELERKEKQLSYECDFWRSSSCPSGEKDAEELFGVYRRHLQEILTEAEETHRKFCERQKRVEILEKREADASRMLKNTRLAFTVRAERPCTAAITVTAFTGKGGWQPQYELTADASAGTLSVVTSARAWQNTGEDWKDCAVLFCTGAPREGLAVPEFRTEYAGGPEPAPRMLSRRAYAAAVPTSIGETDAAAATGAEYAAETEGGAESVFSLRLPVTVLSGEAQRRLELKRESIACKFGYCAFTCFDPAVYLAAEVPAGSFGLSAQARVYGDGSYRGATALSPETERVCAGRADRIFAERKTGNRFRSDLFLGGEKAECDFSVTLTNAGKEAVELTVTDRLPVSSDKAISVEPKELSGADYDAETGRLDWRVRLGGGEKKTLIVRFALVRKGK